MLTNNNHLINTFITYIILFYINHKFNTSETLFINKSSYIQDYAIGIFFVSFIIYCIVYFFNIIVDDNDYNSDSFMSSWNQVNTNGSLFIILVLLYFKIIPFKVITIILLLIIIVVYYPLIQYANNNYLYNDLYKPNLDDLSRALDYADDYNLYGNSKVRYTIKLIGSEIVINFKGTDPNKTNELLSNVNIPTMKYIKDYAKNPDFIKELSSPVGVHGGYLELYLSIRYELYSKCKELLNNGANKIFISGYSLGGGLSTICSFDFHANLNLLNITANDINSVHIAPPAIGNEDFVNLYNKYVINTVRLVHLNDPVPRITDWLYKHTKNEYLVVSNVYSLSAHLIPTYRECIKNDGSLYNYITNNLLVYTVIIIFAIYYIRKFYTRNIVSSRNF
jgi:hypothetical protein